MLKIKEPWYWPGRALMDLYASALLSMDTVHHAPLPEGPKILAANHPTTLDPFLMLTMAPEQVHILITESAFKVQGFGTYLHSAGHIPVVRGQGKTAIDAAVQRLQEGETVGIFPEGSLSPANGGLCSARTGAARLALRTGAPIIPIGIHLDHERIHLRDTQIEDHVEVARWYWGGPYAVTIGTPMVLKGNVENRPYVKEMSTRIVERIGHLAQESSQRLLASGSKGPGHMVLLRTLGKWLNEVV